MFLSRMVSGLLDSNRNNRRYNPDQPRQQQTSSGANSIKTGKKSHKKSDKARRPDPKKAITEFFKTTSRDISNEQPQPSTSKGTTKSLEASEKILTPTKVKSSSWKRSDKSGGSYNAFANNKKTKGLHKRSPNWLKFPNVQGKIAEKVTQNPNTNSACRPGTLYSDVLFGAGSASLVKVKTLTPRRDSAQKKLTKALFKFSSEKNNEFDSGESGEEVKTERNTFPSLHKLPQVKAQGLCSNQGSYNDKTITASLEATLNSEAINNISGTASNPGVNSAKTFIASPEDSLNSEFPVNSSTTAGDSFAKNHNNSYEEADRNDNKLESLKVSYGHYLAQQFQQSTNVPVIAYNSNNMFYQSLYPKLPQFCTDIPQWNFIATDDNLECCPKLLGQFEDENYLKMERLAMLGLNLALGNNSGYNKFSM